jgi:hypothetical protein
VPRHTEHSGSSYTISVMVKLNAEALDVLDHLRGNIPRSTFLRNLLRAEARRVRESNEMGRR